MKRGGGRLRVDGLARKVKAGSPSKKEKKEWDAGWRKVRGRLAM